MSDVAAVLAEAGTRGKPKRAMQLDYLFIYSYINFGRSKGLRMELEHEWDEAKSLANEKKHGIAFEEAIRFEWSYSIGHETQIVDG